MDPGHAPVSPLPSHRSGKTLGMPQELHPARLRNIRRHSARRGVGKAAKRKRLSRFLNMATPSAQYREYCSGVVEAMGVKSSQHCVTLPFLHSLSDTQKPASGKESGLIRSVQLHAGDTTPKRLIFPGIAHPEPHISTPPDFGHTDTRCVLALINPQKMRTGSFSLVGNANMPICSCQTHWR